MIPLAVLTGFLGSGKTTLLARLLKSPRFARTAVIINEFGDVALDHDLIETSEESFVELQTGCLCCRMRGDVALTLEDILLRRDRGMVQPFERVVIETSGLADPAPILHAVMSDDGLSRRLMLAGVVTTVDAVNAVSTLARQPEAVKQVALADRLILTKTDLLEGEASELQERLQAINPGASLLTARFGDVDPEQLFKIAPAAPDHWTGSEVWPAPQKGRRGAARHAIDHFGRHDARVATFAIVRAEPMRAVVLTLLLEALAEHCGGDLLRLKGIVNIAENPGRPAVVHGVQHVFHPPQWLERWPSEDRRCRLVFIVNDIPPAWILALLRAIEIEVGEVVDRS
jgi:G3E family GTPase